MPKALARISLSLIMLSACTSSQQPPYGVPIETGQLQNAAINEASGLTMSQHEDGRLWTLNDGGSPPVIYALAHDGTEHGSVQLSNATNVDWEDMASFEFNDQHWLLIADVGDNFLNREQVTLYVVEEPDMSQPETTVAAKIRFRYPDGPHDAEAVAVDPIGQLLYVLTKRAVPARLYSLPLTFADSDVVTATFLGTIDSIPPPTQDDLNRALTENSWHWQPTAMDYSADGNTAIILTYRAVYLYQRKNGESWLDALHGSPVVFDLGDIVGAESAVMDGGDIIVTVEAIHAPIYRISYQK